uniref:Armadillo repeat-containing protein 1 n=1 Tax=Guillardia theta TaxID=55529 RepID=A0A7S4PG03_GUITH|mmetsp:Transcript_49952/g.156351  ORF Transcript_49952/g.156351 Transcript_49952/m.156351 type:complete len:329 (+) Transcript_49952:443-1429(+)
MDTEHNRRESSYGEVVDARRVIAKLHSLAMDPRNRSVIARDTGCLQNIIRMLDFPADDVVYKALETISYLSSHSVENREILSLQASLLSKLHDLSEMHPTEEVNSLAEHLSKQLSSKKDAELSENPVAKNTSIYVKPSQEFMSPATKSILSRNPKTLMFRVEGLTGQEDTERLERAIIRTKGVISVSLDNLELGDSSIMRILSQRQLTVRAVVRAKCPPEDIVAACEQQEFNASIFDPQREVKSKQKEVSSPPSKGETASGYETPLSERSTQHGSQESDSPRYLTPPDLNACGDRVLISMEDKTLGEKKKEPKDGLSWIQKVGRVLWW